MRKRRKQASLDRLRAEHQRYHQEVSSIRFPSTVPRPSNENSSSSSSGGQTEDDEKAAVWDSVETLKVPPLPATLANPVEAWDCFPQSGTTTSRRTEEGPAGIRITAKTLLTANRGEVRVDKPVAGTPRITTGSPRSTLLPLKSSTPRTVLGRESARPPLQLPPGEIVLASGSVDILVGDTVTAAKPSLGQQQVKTLSYVPHTLEDAPSKVPSLGRKTQDSSSASKSTETSASRRLTSKIKGILKKLDSVHVECSVFKNLPHVKTDEAVAQAYLQDVVRALRAKEAVSDERQASPSPPVCVGELINRYMALSESKKPAGDAGAEEGERVIKLTADAAGEHMKMNAGSQTSLDDDRTLSCKEIQCSLQTDEDNSEEIEASRNKRKEIDQGKHDKCTQSSPVNAVQGHRDELTEHEFVDGRVNDAAQSRRLDPYEKFITRRPRQGDDFLERCREKIGGLLERCRALEISTKDTPCGSIRVKDHRSRVAFKGKENKNLAVAAEGHARAAASLAGDIHSTSQHPKPRSRSLHQRSENAPLESDAWQKLESRLASVKSAVRNAIGEILDYDQMYKELADIEKQRTQIERQRTDIEQRDGVRVHLRAPHDQQETKKANTSQRTKRPRNTRSPGREPGSKLLRSSLGRIEPHISAASRDRNSSLAPEKQSEALKSVLRRPQRPSEVFVAVRPHAASKERTPAWVKRMAQHKPKLEIFEHPERGRSDKSRLSVTVKRRSLRPPESIFRAGKSITWLTDGPNDGDFIPTSEDSKRVGENRQASGKTAAVRSGVSAYYGFPSTSDARAPEQTGERKVENSVAHTTVPQVSGATREDENGTRCNVETKKALGAPKEGKPGWVIVGDYCISELERAGGREVHVESDKQPARALPLRPTMERPHVGHRLVQTEHELLEQSLLEALLSDLVQGEQPTHRDEMLPLLQAANLAEMDERIAPANTAYVSDSRPIHGAPGRVDVGCQADFKDPVAPTYARETSGFMVGSGFLVDSEGHTRPVASTEEVPLLSGVVYSDKAHNSVACQTKDAPERQRPVLGGHAPGRGLQRVSALRTTTGSQTELLSMHQTIDRPPCGYHADTRGCQTTESTAGITISSVADQESDMTEPLLPHREPLYEQQLQRSQVSSTALLRELNLSSIQEERLRLRPLRTVRHDAGTQTRQEATHEKEVQAVTGSSTTSPSTPSTPVSSPEHQARLEEALAPLRPGTRNRAQVKLLRSGTEVGEQPVSSETRPFLELEERRPLLETPADVVKKLRPPAEKDGGSVSTCRGFTDKLAEAQDSLGETRARNPREVPRERNLLTGRASEADRQPISEVTGGSISACRGFTDRIGEAQDSLGETRARHHREVPRKEAGTAPRNLERDSVTGRASEADRPPIYEQVVEETQPLLRDINTQPPAEVTATSRQSPTRQNFGRPVTVLDGMDGAADAAIRAPSLPSPLPGSRLPGHEPQLRGLAKEEVVEKPENPLEKAVLASRGFIDRIVQTQDYLRRNLREVPGEEATLASAKLETEASEAGTQAGTRNQVAIGKLAEETQPLLSDNSKQPPADVVATGPTRQHILAPGTMQAQLESTQPSAAACRQGPFKQQFGPATVRQQIRGPGAVFQEECVEQPRTAAQQEPARRGERYEAQARAESAEVAATPRQTSTRQRFGDPDAAQKQSGGLATAQQQLGGSEEGAERWAHQEPARRRERIQEPECSIRVQRNLSEPPSGVRHQTPALEEAGTFQQNGETSALGGHSASVRLLQGFDIQGTDTKPPATGFQFLQPSGPQPRLLGAAETAPPQVAGLALLKDTGVGARLTGTSLPPQLGSTSQLKAPQVGFNFQMQLERGPRGRYPLLFGRQVLPPGELTQLAELERKAAAALRGKWLPSSPSALPRFQMSPSLPLSSSYSRLYDTSEEKGVARLVLEPDSTSTSTSSEEESTSSSSTSSGVSDLPVHFLDEGPPSFRQISEGEVEAGVVPGYNVQASEGEITLGEIPQ